MNLDFCAYTNYFDRKIKRIEVRGPEYLNNYLLRTMTDILFNPNDGVNTTVILENFSGIPLSQEPNYLLAWYTLEGGSVVIDSRWFIMDMNRIREGQWKVTLRRDLVADYWDIIMNAPCFIEKGWVNRDNPLIFNKEQGSYNQIKKDEILLKDNTNLAWIVGYWTKQSPDSTINSLEGEFIGDVLPDITIATDITHWDKYIYTQNDYIDAGGLNKSQLAFKTYSEDVNMYGQTDPVDVSAVFNDFAAYGNVSDEYKTTAAYSIIVPSDKTVLLVAGEISTEWKNSTLYSSITTADMANSLTQYWLSNADYTSITALNNKIIKDSTGAYYRIKINTGVKHFSSPDISTSSTLATKMFAFADNCTKLARTANAKTALSLLHIEDMITMLNVLADKLRMSLNQLTLEDGFTYKFKTQTNVDKLPIATLDSPFNVFCIPYNPVNDSIDVVVGGPTSGSNDNYFTLSSRISLLTAFEIARKNGTKVYDIQILPFCPFGNLIGWTGPYQNILDLRPIIPTGYGPFNLDLGSSRASMVAHVEGNTIQTDWVKSLIIHSPNSSFQGRIDVSGYGLSKWSSDLAVKNASMTEKLRLCSPNYASVFEMDYQANNGISYIEYNCSYKPFTPYIHLNPNWGGIYGRDFDDQRGLVCAGSFSMSLTRDEFAQYEIQNRNYQLSFQRNIQKQETDNQINLHQQYRNLALQGLGTVVGAAAGVVSGNPFMASTALGTGLNAVRSMQNIEDQQKVFQNSIKYQQDQFGYQLQNIKALPETLTNVGAFDINNKIFPFIELYGPTSQETNAATLKILFNGMSIGVVGKLADYLRPASETSFSSLDDGGCYIKGDIIRLGYSIDGIHTKAVDSHTADEIISEIYKGIYVGGQV